MEESHHSLGTRKDLEEQVNLLRVSRMKKGERTAEKRYVWSRDQHVQKIGGVGTYDVFWDIGIT